MERVTAVIVADSLAGDTGKAAHLGQQYMHVLALPKHTLHTRQSCCHKHGSRRVPRGRSCRPMAQSGAASGASTQNLTKADLVEYLRSGCKPRDRWK